MNADQRRPDVERRCRGLPTQGVLLFVSVWASLVCVWAFANWPALTTAWWYRDDFCALKNGVRSCDGATLACGRPLQAVWMLTFAIDGRPPGPWQNIALRWFQGGLHCAVATVAGMLLWRQRRTWRTFLSILPFVAWPFNGEAVLWRVQGVYPLAALCGVCGVWLIQHPRHGRRGAALPGVFSVGAGMLFNQAAAFAGLVVHLLLSALMIMEGNIDFRVQGRKVMQTCVGCGLGGMLSYAIAKSYAGQRAKFATDVAGKLGYFWRLNTLFLTSPRFYPPWLSAVHIALVVLAVLAVAAATLSRRSSRSGRRSAASLLVVATAFVTPYAGALLAAENWPSWRVMYLAPLLISGMWNALDAALSALKINAVAALCPLLLIVIGYVSIARVNAAEYPMVFQCDRAMLRQVESSAVKEGVTRVFVAPPPSNVYGITYMHGDSKLSAFQVDWAARYFIPIFSSLQSSYAEPTSTACLARCAGTQVKGDRGLRFYKVQDDAVGCVCWGPVPVPAARLLGR